METCAIIVAIKSILCDSLTALLGVQNTDESFRFHNKKIDEIRCKLYSTENRCSFEKYPSPLKLDRTIRRLTSYMSVAKEYEPLRHCARDMNGHLSRSKLELLTRTLIKTGKTRKSAADGKLKRDSSQWMQ